jgi:hypothetical protein
MVSTSYDIDGDGPYQGATYYIDMGENHTTVKTMRRTVDVSRYLYCNCYPPIMVMARAKTVVKKVDNTYLWVKHPLIDIRKNLKLSDEETKLLTFQILQSSAWMSM